jgi:hypothetical protein
LPANLSACKQKSWDWALAGSVFDKKGAQQALKLDKRFQRSSCWRWDIHSISIAVPANEKTSMKSAFSIKVKSLLTFHRVEHHEPPP